MKNKITPILFFLCVFFLGYHFASAATLDIRSSASSVQVGGTVTLAVVVNAQGTAINDASGTIQFSPALFNVLSVSKSSSVFSIWVEDPSYSNSSGTITFEGGVPTPGYSGSAGNVITITLQAKSEGQANFTFSDAAVRANDGLGTDVLNGQQGASVAVIAKPAVVTPPTTPATVQKPVTTPTTPVQKPTTTETPTVPVTETATATPVPVETPVVSVQVQRTPLLLSIGTFSMPAIYGLIILLLLLLIAILVTYLLTRRHNKSRNFGSGTIVVNGDNIKNLTTLRKRIEKHLDSLQTLRHTRILTKIEKEIKEDMEGDLDEIDIAIEKQKAK